MATIYSDVSVDLSEYLLLPNLTTKDCLPEKSIWLHPSRNSQRARNHPSG